MFISIYYRLLIPYSIISLAKYSGINMHPSYLPFYKGAFSNSWAIINGEKFTGITFHYMTDKIDSGNIIFQKKINITKNDTAYSLYLKQLYITLKQLKYLINLVKIAVPDAEVNVLDKTGMSDHFIIHVTSAAFEELGIMDRHRKVQDALNPAMQDGRIHAAEIKTATP